MPGAQRTFQLIPANPNNATSKPPMTSKAAKKAYLQARRGPRVSRAEQRRLDKEELDRQKKEYEKERNAAKAKSVREKKAAKAAEERDQRRQAGLPEPSRFVRASQPTIAAFARGGTKRKLHDLESVADDSEDTMAEEVFMPAVKLEPPAKRAVGEQESDDEFGEFPSLSQTDILDKIDSSILSLDEDASLSKLSLKKVDQDSLGLGGFTSMEPTDTLAGGEAVSPMSLKSKPRRSTPRLSVRASLNRSSPRDSQELPKNGGKKKHIDTPLSTQMLAELVTTQIHSEAAQAEARSDGAEASQMSVQLEDSVTNRASSRLNQGSPTNNPLQEHFTKMPPPAVPIKGRNATTFTPSSHKYTPMPRNQSAKHFAIPAKSMPPSATQLFLENNLDDFLPSPSQETRELLDVIEDVPSNTQIAKELGPKQSIVHSKTVSKPEDEFLGDLFSTQDFAMSSQDLIEINTPSREAFIRTRNRTVPAPPARNSREISRSSLHSVDVNTRSTATATPRTFPGDMARQKYSAPATRVYPQMAATITPRALSFPPRTARLSMAQSRAANYNLRKSSTPTSIIPHTNLCEEIVDISTEGADSRRDHHRVQPLRRAAETHGTTPLAIAPQEKLCRSPPPIAKGAPVPPKNPTPRPLRKRFFVEKEDDIYRAAVDESKKQAAAEEKARQAQRAAKQIAPAASTNGKRTLHRVQSTTTDYGDDDFLSSQELLDLCK